MIPHTKQETTGKVVSAYYTVHPDDRQKYIDAVIPHLASTAELDGCVYYVFAQDVTDPNTIHLVEGWRDQAALDAHLSDEPFLAAVRAVQGGVRVLDYQAQVYDVAAQAPARAPGEP